MDGVAPRIHSRSPSVRGLDSRHPDRIRHHYEVEKGLAQRLRNAAKEERGRLYAATYDELYRQVPDHPQLRRKSSGTAGNEVASRRRRFLDRFLRSDAVFLEIGPGDCALARQVAEVCPNVYAVDVSAEITGKQTLPSNVQLILSDGTSVPLPVHSVDIAYSDQLMEHLHPDDALEQLRNIFAVLAPGGLYVCITPNRLNGPHDISRHYDHEATGLHLHEYSIAELVTLFKDVGFSSIRLYAGGAGLFVRFPTPLAVLCERILNLLPYGARKPIAASLPFKALLGIRLVGLKR